MKVIITVYVRILLVIRYLLNLEMEMIWVKIRIFNKYKKLFLLKIENLDKKTLQFNKKLKKNK
jgi:hypothetical protein